jgi:chromosome segregation ATPase
LLKKKDLELADINSKFLIRSKDLEFKIGEKEKEIAELKQISFENEKRLKTEFDYRDEELKLSVTRLQMQLKSVTQKFEQEIVEEKSKLKSMQAEYALREVEWKTQKEKENEIKARAGDLEAKLADLKVDYEGKESELKGMLTNLQQKLEAANRALAGKDEEVKLLSRKLHEEAKEREKIKIKVDEANRALNKLRKKCGFFLWLWYPNEPR